MKEFLGGFLHYLGVEGLSGHAVLRILNNKSYYS
jgi:hypothetical protein